MTETQHELYRLHRTVQDKYTYFLLAAAAAAIGLSLQQTAESPVQWSLAPLGGAVLSWGASFYCGCRRLQYISSILFANMHLLQVEQGAHPSVPKQAIAIEATSRNIRAEIEISSERANRLGKGQFRLLILGSLLFIGWHLTEMVLRTNQSSIRDSTALLINQPSGVRCADQR